MIERSLTYNLAHRVVVLGTGGVGKSALIRRVVYPNDEFSDALDPTIQDEYRKEVEVDGQMALIDIEDTAGQDEFASLQDQAIAQGDGYILVYGVENPNSLQDLKYFYNKIQRIRDGADFPVVLVGNKCDLTKVTKPIRRVTTEEGQNLANDWRALRNFEVPFLETSSKEDRGCKAVFRQIVRELRRVEETGIKEDVKEPSFYFNGLTLSTILLCILLSPLLVILGILALVFLCARFLLTTINLPSCDCERFIIWYESLIHWLFNKKEKQRSFINLHRMEADAPTFYHRQMVLALKDFQVVREFSSTIFWTTLLALVVLPLLLVFQLILFLFPGWCGKPFVDAVVKTELNKPKKLLWVDFFGVFIVRPSLGKEDAATPTWFFRQTIFQLLQRLVYSFIVILIYGVGMYNLKELIAGKRADVSLTEYLSPFVFIILVGILFAIWCSYDVHVSPPINYFKKRLFKFRLTFSERNDFYTTVTEYLSNYVHLTRTARRVPSNTWTLFKALLFAFVPFLQRLAEGNEVFDQDSAFVLVGAFFVHFIFCYGFIRSLDVFHEKDLKNYADWMKDMTFLLRKDEDSENFEKKLRRNTDEQIELTDLKGAFLSFTNHHNLAAWLQLRAFFMQEGYYHFSNLEVVTSYVVLLCLFLALGCIAIIITGDTEAHNLLLSEGYCMALLALVYGFIILGKITHIGFQVEEYQNLQQKFLTEQIMYNSHKVVGAIVRGANRKQTVFNASSTSNIREAFHSITSLDEDAPLLQAEKEEREAMRSQVSVDQKSTVEQTDDVAGSPLPNPSESVNVAMMDLMQSRPMSTESQREELLPSVAGASNEQPCVFPSIVVSGRVGFNDWINGTYKCGEHMVNGRPYYICKKTGWCLKYHEKKWMFDHRGLMTDRQGNAVVVQDVEKPSLVTKVWKVFDGKSFVDDPLIRVTEVQRKRLPESSPGFLQDPDYVSMAVEDESQDAGCERSVGFHDRNRKARAKQQPESIEMASERGQSSESLPPTTALEYRPSSIRVVKQGIFENNFHEENQKVVQVTSLRDESGKEAQFLQDYMLNALNLVKEKRITPLLFGIELTKVLGGTQISVILSVCFTVAKLAFVH